MNREEVLQSLFDRAVAGLADQGFEQSMSPWDIDTCAYRGTGGKKCAVGHLLADEHWNPALNTSAASSLHDKAPGALAEIVGMSPSPEDPRAVWDEYWDRVIFLDRLQDAHDGAESPEAMQENLRSVARAFDLEIPPVLPA